jgi:hypothetical protein
MNVPLTEYRLRGCPLARLRLLVAIPKDAEL